MYNIFSIYIFKWLASGDLLSNWSVNIDFFTAIMISTVNIVSALVQIYSIEYMKDEKNKCKFFCYMSLFTFFMLFLVSSGNLIQLYLFYRNTTIMKKPLFIPPFWVPFWRNVLTFLALVSVSFPRPAPNKLFYILCTQGAAMEHQVIMNMLTKPQVLLMFC